MRDHDRRLVALERVAAPHRFRFLPEHLASISDEDLEFVADLPIRGRDGLGIPELFHALGEAGSARLCDIVNRMRYGPR